MTDTADKRAEPIQWKVDFKVDKYHGSWTPAQIDSGEAEKARYDTIDRKGNLLMIGGASALWQRLIGTGVTAFDNSNAHLGVGDSTTAAADSQTDLQAATNKLRMAMDSTYPQHTDSTSSSGAKSIIFRSTFDTTDANFDWEEWALFNASSTGRMLNRKVESLGTKTSSATWTLTVTLSLA